MRVLCFYRIHRTLWVIIPCDIIHAIVFVKGGVKRVRCSADSQCCDVTSQCSVSFLVPLACSSAPFSIFMLFLFLHLPERGVGLISARLAYWFCSGSVWMADLVYRCGGAGWPVLTIVPSSVGLVPWPSVIVELFAVHIGVYQFLSLASFKLFLGVWLSMMSGHCIIHAASFVSILLVVASFTSVRWGNLFHLFCLSVVGVSSRREKVHHPHVRHRRGCSRFPTVFYMYMQVPTYICVVESFCNLLDSTASSLL